MFLTLLCTSILIEKVAFFFILGIDRGMRMYLKEAGWVQQINQERLMGMLLRGPSSILRHTLFLSGLINRKKDDVCNRTPKIAATCELS